MSIRFILSFSIALLSLMSGTRLNAQDAKANTKLDVVNSIEMKSLQGGAFEMGTTSTEGQQGFPVHMVTIEPFKIAETDITFDQYDSFARATSRPFPQDEGFGRGDRPVVNVSWREMQSFITWLNSGTGHHFRLPSEAEWEYAARGGATTEYYWGDKLVPGVVNARDSRFKGTSPVRTFPPNPFGLYDMSGNVWQAVEDCLHPTYNGAPANGSPWIDRSCDIHIARGGFYGSITRGITVTSRSAIGETFRSMSLGFRLAEDIRKPK